MTAQIFDIGDYRPHRAGYAQCNECQHQHVSVAPANVMLMECPACGAMACHWIDEEDILRDQESKDWPEAPNPVG